MRISFGMYDLQSQGEESLLNCPAFNCTIGEMSTFFATFLILSEVERNDHTSQSEAMVECG